VRLLLALAALLGTADAGVVTAPDPLEGAWLGALQAGPVRLRLVLHLHHAAGGWTATFDSIDQNTRDIPISAVTVQGPQLDLDVRIINGHYTGRRQGDSITGTWTQNGQTMPLALRKTDVVPVLNRPQEPKRPLPYAEIPVTAGNPASHVQLACTLRSPAAGQEELSGQRLCFGAL
jgi:hypothetical protein